MNNYKDIQSRESREIKTVEFSKNADKTEFLLSDIHWERINAYFTISAPSDSDGLRFFLVNRKGRANARLIFEKEEINGGKKLFTLSLNITNPGNNEALREGVYRIFVCDSNLEILGICKCDFEKETLSEKSRSFLYRNRSHSFIVNFDTNEAGELLSFVFSGEPITAPSIIEIND